MPKEKFRVLLGLKSCQKNGMLNSKIGYAVSPLYLFIMVNQQSITAIKYK